jgi:hypothetical protein
VLFGLLSSSLLAKVVFGAAALAAVGGVAAAMPSPDTAPAPVTAVVQPPAHATPASVGTASGRAEQDLVHLAEQFAAEVEVWGQCVAEEARAHSGEAFDPEEACGEPPKASDHGLGTDNAPGLNKVDGETIPAAQSEQDKVDNPNKPVKSGDDDDDSESSKVKADKPKNPGSASEDDD